MALILVCDGCGERGGSFKEYGHLEPAYYCGRCAPVWDAFDAAQTAIRLRLVEEFEDWRRDALRTLRNTLTRLPDE